MDIIFLDIEDVLYIHSNQIELYGGQRAVRDLGLLESALAMPKTAFSGDYVHVSIFEMAAAYLYHIAMNHPFVDGNKRTATVSAIAFLKLNGIDFKAENMELADFVIAVASGEKDKADVAAFLESHCC